MGPVTEECLMVVKVIFIIYETITTHVGGWWEDPPEKHCDVF